jgi:hypothetical protein
MIYRRNRSRELTVIMGWNTCGAADATDHALMI